jgi:GDP-mannose 6-dehydrogenase
LLGKGFYLRIYDNNIHIARLTGKNKEYIDRHIPHLACFLSNDLQKIVEENEVIVVCNKEKQVVEALKNVKDKVIIDMVRLPEDIRMNNTYTGINWVITEEVLTTPSLNGVEV